MARIVLTTFGTLGDLNPYIAVARELGARGHRPVIATHASYRERVERAGSEFHPVRPDFTDFGDLEEVYRRSMDARGGSRYVVLRLALPFVRASYEDLRAACRGADALVSHMLTFAAPLVAEQGDIPRIHTLLQPYSLFSAFDPPLDGSMPGFALLRHLGPRACRQLWSLARAVSRRWFHDVASLRAELGLRSRAHPLFDGFSSALNLALFSPVLAPPQPDWPPRTVVTGFPIHDRDEQGEGMPPELRSFLDEGPAPIVFTLGSSGVWSAGSFYDEAASAAALLGMRVVLLTGANRPTALPRGVIAVSYAPHSELFPRAAVVVHQGGIGTTGQALRSGRPMLIVPFSHDQPDNAACCARLGVARVVPRCSASARRLARELRALMDDAEMRSSAEQVALRVRAEDGCRTAADAIEALLDARCSASPRRASATLAGP